MFQPIRGRGSHLVFLIGPKNTNLVEDVEISEKQDGRPGLWLTETFSTSPLKLLNGIQRNLTGIKISTSSTILLPVKFRWIPFSGFRGEVENVLANQRPGRPSFFSIGLKNTNLIEDIVILRPVKFRWIPFTGFKGELKMSRPIRGQSGHLVYLICPKTHTW